MSIKTEVLISVIILFVVLILGVIIPFSWICYLFAFLFAAMIILLCVPILPMFDIPSILFMLATMWIPAVSGILCFWLGRHLSGMRLMGLMSMITARADMLCYFVAVYFGIMAAVIGIINLIFTTLGSHDIGLFSWLGDLAAVLPGVVGSVAFFALGRLAGAIPPTQLLSLAFGQVHMICFCIAFLLGEPASFVISRNAQLFGARALHNIDLVIGNAKPLAAGAVLFLLLGIMMYFVL